MEADFFTLDEQRGVLKNTFSNVSCTLKYSHLFYDEELNCFGYSCDFSSVDGVLNSETIQFVIAFERYAAQWNALFSEELPAAFEILPYFFNIYYCQTDKIWQDAIDALEKMSNFLSNTADETTFSVTAYTNLLYEVYENLEAGFKQINRCIKSCCEKNDSHAKRLKELEPFFQLVRQKCPSDYKGGRDGPIYDVFENKYKEAQKSAQDRVSYSTFRRLYMEWQRLYDPQRQNDFLEMNGLPPQKNEYIILSGIDPDFSFLDAVKQKNRSKR